MRHVKNTHFNCKQCRTRSNAILNKYASDLVDKICSRTSNNNHEYVRMSNIADPDQTQVNHYAGPGLHCLQILQTLVLRAASHIRKFLLNEYRTNRLNAREILNSPSTSLGYKLFA